MALFTSNIIENINYVICPSDIDKTGVTNFEALSKQWLSYTVLTHVLDFRNVKKIHQDFFSITSRFRQELTKKNSRLVSVNMNGEVLSLVTRAGMDKALGYIKDFNKKPVSAPKISEEELRKLLIKTLVQSAYHAMNIMFNSTLAADENYTHNAKEISFDHFSHASSLNIDNAFLKATFRLYFPEKTIVSLSRAFIGGNTNALDQETIESTATEFLNIIYGRAKSNLNDEHQFQLPPAIPTLCRGQNFSQLRRSDPKNLVYLPLASPFGSFFLEIDFG